MTPPPTQRRRTAHGLARLTGVAALGADRAAQGLSDLLGREIDLDATGVHFGSSSRALDLIGGPDAAAVGIYLSMDTGITGHVMLFFTLDQAYQLVDQLLELAPGTTTELDEMAISALGEVGNITAGAFLTELGDATAIAIHPSPPSVMVDLAGALLNSLLAEIAAQGGEVLVVETVFQEAGSAIRGFILITPDPPSVEILMDRLLERA